MATRFYFANNTPALTPSLDAGWEVTSGYAKKKMMVKQFSDVITPAGSTFGNTIPITTTQDILAIQAICPTPIPPQTIAGTFSFVASCAETAATDNATLAVVVKVISGDGGTVRGTLFTVFGTDTEFPLNASRATRIVNASAVSPVTTMTGDLLVVEIGVNASAPSSSDLFSVALGNSAATDFALTSAVTGTGSNPWCELSQDLFPAMQNNYQFVKVGDGLSTTEKIR